MLGNVGNSYGRYSIGIVLETVSESVHHSAGVKLF